MKKLFSILLIGVFAFVGCSTNELPEANTRPHIDDYLSGYFCNIDGSGGAYGKIECDTIYNGTQYLLNLYPYASYAKNGMENDGLVTSAIYYLNGDKIANVSAFPFSVSYTPNLQPGKYTLSVKPAFSNEYIIWETKETNVIVSKQKEPEPVIIPVSGITMEKPFFEILRYDACILNSNVYPENATNKDIVYTVTSDIPCARIDKTGNNYVFQTYDFGSARVIAQTIDGNFVDYWDVSIVGIEKFATLKLNVGYEKADIEEDSHSYVFAEFNTQIHDGVIINEINIKNNLGQVVYTNKYFECNKQNSEGRCYIYKTPNVIADYGVNPYSATGWSSDIQFYWNGFNYSLSATIE